MNIFRIFTLAASAQESFWNDFVSFDATDEGFEKLVSLFEEKNSPVKSLVQKEQALKSNRIKGMTYYIEYKRTGSPILGKLFTDGKEEGYGCHCAVNGRNDLMAGSGKPLDQIDLACKRHKQCMTCVMADDSTCSWWQPYEVDYLGSHVECRKFRKFSTDPNQL